MKKGINRTDVLRGIIWTIWIAACLSGIIGWWMGLDPEGLSPVIAWATGGLLVGEASNVGKRATFNIDAVEAER